MTAFDWKTALGNLPGIPEVRVYRWLPGGDLRTRPPELWAELVHDHVGGDW